MVNFHLQIATLFGVGRIVPAPGTFGSLLALPFFYLINFILPEDNYIALYIITILILFGVGVWASHHAEKILGKDASSIIIDEFVGQLFVFSLMPSITVWQCIIGFVLFRFFDIIKPLGIKRVEKIGGGLGIVLDDMLAALYALITLNLTNFII